MKTRIDRHPLPDPTEPVMLYSDTGHFLGKLIFEGKAGQQTSRLEQPADQLPYRRWPLKQKHRQR